MTATVLLPGFAVAAAVLMAIGAVLITLLLRKRDVERIDAGEAVAVPA